MTIHGYPLAEIQAVWNKERRVSATPTLYKWTASICTVRIGNGSEEKEAGDSLPDEAETVKRSLLVDQGVFYV